jgi:hypothetical protein
VHDAAPPPTLQAAPAPDAEVVLEPEEPVEKVEMPDADLLTEEPSPTAEADAPGEGEGADDADAEADSDESEDAKK